MRFGHQSSRLSLPQIAIVLVIAASSKAFAQAPTTPVGPTGAMLQPVYQPNGDFTVMPQNLPASRRSGLVITVDTRWVNGYGYRPIEVTIMSSPTSTPTAHTISLRLHSGWENTISVAQEFELPAGATRASTIISVPFYEEQSMLGIWWDVRVDGAKDIDLSMDKTSASRRMTGSSASASTIRILVPNSQAIDKTVTSTTAADFEVLSLELGHFPARWIDYTCLDVVSLSLKDLDQLARTSPAALESIERWVRAGGQLWISDVGAKLEKLPDVSKQLMVPAALVHAATDPVVKDANEKTNEKADGAVERADIRPAEAGWRPARSRFGGPGGAGGQAQGFTDVRTGRNRWVNDPGAIAQLDQDPNFRRTAEASSPDDPNVERRFPSDSSQWYVEQRLGLGTLRAFRGPNEAAVFAQAPPVVNPNATPNANGETGGQMPRALTVALRSTRHWNSRHGLIPDSSNPAFANLLVPGVGRAPVTEFQVLITLFVLLIGPFNYWILKRYKRSQLLVLTVPLAAGVATTALFAYAILADGFSTKVRVRSYTTIDQTTGEAACWAWTSYYAGLAPGKGLTIPADMVVYPILPNWGGDDGGTTRAMAWDADQELLTGGWLMSRTPTQYLMVRSRKTPSRLDVTSGNGKMQIVNRLGARIESLLVLDDAGKIFSGEDLANESRVALAPISHDDAVKRIVQLMRDNEPEPPPELSTGERDFMGRRGRSTRRMYGRYTGQPNEGQLNENLANRALSDLAGMNGRPALDLPPRTYVAITTTGPEVDSGISYAAEDTSFHVVVGHW